MYFDRDLQDRAVGLFTESLVRRGYLALGTHESLMFCSYRDAFHTVDRRYRVYQRVG
jgi:chemotaxis protein methyltransferase CheR